MFLNLLSDYRVRALTKVITVIQIIAAGNSGNENLELRIDDQVVQSWSQVGGNAVAEQYNVLEFQWDGPITADRIKIAFTNDGPQNDLRIDKLVIDGVAYETENPNVLSTGTWAYNHCSPGYYCSEWLNCNGFFQFATAPRTSAGPIPADVGTATAATDWSVVDNPVVSSHPVAILGPASRNGGSPGVPGIRYVDSQGFDIRFQEFTYDDGIHVNEKVDWMLLPQGRFVTNDGSIWEVGKFTMTGNGVWSTQTFSQRFTKKPAIFLSIQTHQGGHPLMTRVRNTTAAGFEAALFTEENLLAQVSPNEEVAYLAVLPAAPSGVVTLGNKTLPYLLEDMFVGSSPEPSPSGFTLTASEEFSLDLEVNHPRERTRVLQIGTLVFAQDYMFRDADPFSFRIEKVSSEISLPEGFRVGKLLSGTDFTNPVDLAVAPDGRIFVAEEGGLVWIIKNGVKLPTPYLDLRDELFRGDGDEGALSAIALDPDFANNNYVYVLYTALENGFRFGRLSRFRSFANFPDISNRNIQKILIGTYPMDGLIQDVFHNVGDINFGVDGSLLLSWGDTASNQEDDLRPFRSQNLSDPAGKIFRINRFTGRGFISNPFYDGNLDSWASKILAIGLRNGFRFAVHPYGGSSSPGLGKPGTLYISDVGRERTEELNRATGGENFGWPYFEGLEVNRPGGQAINHQLPIAIQSHPEYRCIMGGVFTNLSTWPGPYQGFYLTTDFVTGLARGYQPNANHTGVTEFTFGSGMRGITSMAIDPTSQRIYFLGRGTDIIFSEDVGLDGLYYLEYVPN